MSLWNWLRDAFAAPLPEEPEEREAEMPPEEAFLRNLLLRVTDTVESAPQVAVGDREFWAAVARLTASGRERTAIDLLSRFVAARPDDHAVAARLAEILCERLEHETARPLLERLTAAPAHSLRSHLLLADADERNGDDAGARRHLEAILAYDLDYPQARSRADRLARALAPPPPATPPAAPTLEGLPREGADLGGRYRLVRELGRGSAGAVYLARDDELTRAVALKILHPQTRARAELERARAWLEARVATALRHPGVIAIYDLDEERQLVAMELCAGGALAHELRVRPLAPVDALVRAAELCRTLAAVHLRGVVHGDVKPANLLFREAGGELVLGDFGLAQLGRVSDESGAPRGTLAYMAPEQRRGGALAPACDVYAAGVILLEMLHGSAALAGWLGDRAGLLTGGARWAGTLPAAVTAALGAERAAAATRLAALLLADDAAARPSAADAASALAELAESAQSISFSPHL